MAALRYSQGAVNEAEIAVLDHLSGPTIGEQTILRGETLDIYLGSDRHIVVHDIAFTENNRSSEQFLARLRWTRNTYQIEATPKTPIWINGRRLQNAELLHDDIVEFGEQGPISRYRVIDFHRHRKRFLFEILSDCWDYFENSRKPLARRLLTAIGVGLRQLAFSSSILFKVAVLSTFLVVGLVMYQQQQINQMQQSELADNLVQLQEFANALKLTREEALKPADLSRLEHSLTEALDSSRLRLADLEKSATAAEGVIRKASPSVVFLQGAYGYRDPESGQEMRYVIGSDGKPLTNPGGTPLIALEGTGEPAERPFTGTGFAVADGTFLVTNRHIALPWTSDGGRSAFRGRSLEPFMVKLIGYVQGSDKPLELELVRAADDTDLALFRIKDQEARLTPLPISEKISAHGNPVVVLGYPTGLRSLVARAGKSFIEAYQKSGQSGYWDVGKKLSEHDLIKPLASRGIVAQTTDEFIVYDAATTRGGSGGPVLNLKGEVVGVTVAILPEYGGSNLGITSQRLQNFIAETNNTTN